jgi:hypothetical protein
MFTHDVAIAVRRRKRRHCESCVSATKGRRRRPPHGAATVRRAALRCGALQRCPRAGHQLMANEQPQTARRRMATKTTQNWRGSCRRWRWRCASQCAQRRPALTRQPSQQQRRAEPVAVSVEDQQALRVACRSRAFEPRGSLRLRSSRRSSRRNSGSARAHACPPRRSRSRSLTARAAHRRRRRRRCVAPCVGATTSSWATRATRQACSGWARFRARSRLTTGGVHGRARAHG